MEQQEEKKIINLLKEQYHFSSSIIRHIKEQYDKLHNKKDKSKEEQFTYLFLQQLLLDFWDYY